MTSIGDPQPEVTWYKGSKKLKPKKLDRRIKIHWDIATDLYTLEINECTLDDADDYTVRAANKHGEVSITVTVTVVVEDKDQDRQDVITISYSDQTDGAEMAGLATDSTSQVAITADSTSQVAIIQEQAARALKITADEDLNISIDIAHTNDLIDEIQKKDASSKPQLILMKSTKDQVASDDISDAPGEVKEEADVMTTEKKAMEPEKTMETEIVVKEEKTVVEESVNVEQTVMEQSVKVGQTVMEESVKVEQTVIEESVKVEQTVTEQEVLIEEAIYSAVDVDDEAFGEIVVEEAVTNKAIPLPQFDLYPEPQIVKAGGTLTLGTRVLGIVTYCLLNVIFWSATQLL